MPALETILAAIQAVDSTAPAFVSLVTELKSAFSATDQATIDAAMNAANATADAQHNAAQSL